MRIALRTFGEVLITLGVITLLFVGYEIWWTSFLSDRAAARNTAELRQSWSLPVPTLDTPADDSSDLSTQPEIGQTFALMTIPRLGGNVDSAPVVQGVGLDELAQGLGHYPQSAMPGAEGNFAVAGHRITYGEPLRYVQDLQEGDNVYVETRDTWFRYELRKTEIVLPDAVWTITPAPFGDDTDLNGRLITLTTCHPTFGNEFRWIWWGELAETRSKSEGPLALAVSN